jgi:hypothetical protein
MLFLITERCSMNCPHCMIGAQAEGESASRATVIETLQFADDAGIKMINVSGGEPTEHPDFWDIFSLILRRGKKRFIVLATNGSWLKRPGFVQKLTHLQKQYPFAIQVTAIKGLYQDVQRTQTLFMANRRRFGMAVEIITQITCIDQLGRAQGKDWSHLGKSIVGGVLHKRRAPNCFNVLSAARGSATLQQLVGLLEIGLANFCKPMVDWRGDIHIGECPECTTIGHVADSFENILSALQAAEPCGACGVATPDKLIAHLRRQ